MINTVVTIRNPQNPILIIKAPTLRPAHSEKQSDGLEWLKRAQRSCQRSSGVLLVLRGSFFEFGSCYVHGVWFFGFGCTV